MSTDPADKDIFLSMSKRLSSLLDEFKVMKTPEYLREMGVSSMPGCVPDYASLLQAVTNDQLLQSDAKLFCMAFGFLEQQFDTTLRHADPETPTDDEADTILKLKLLVHLESLLPTEMKDLIGFLRKRRSEKTENL